MTETLNEISTPINKVEKIVHKCPDYVLRAQKNYYNKKKEDPEFIKKERERLRKYRADNREHINELDRLRKQKKRIEEKAKKEQDAKKNKLDIQEHITTTENNLPKLEALSV